MIKWVGDWPPSRQPYSWHTVYELSGDQTGEPNSLHILQDYVDSRRSTSSRKRKSPDTDYHSNPLPSLCHLASDSTRSSPVSDLSHDSITSTEDSDCYNCKLQVRNESITIKLVSSHYPSRFSSTNFETAPRRRNRHDHIPNTFDGGEGCEDPDRPG